MAKKTETKAKPRKAATTKPAPKKATARAATTATGSAPRMDKGPTTTATESTTEEKQDKTTAHETTTASPQPPEAMSPTQPPKATTTTLPTQAPSASPDTRLPAKGTVLQKRDRQGAVRCECVIVDGGVQYRETIYRSLSAAAVAAAKDLGLAAKAMNGFTFWGLTKAARKGADPAAQLEKAWTRYWSHLESTLKGAKGDEHREPVLTTIQRHARVLQNLHDEVA